MTLYEQMKALVAASGGGIDLAAPLAADPLGMQPPALMEAETALAMAARLEDLLATADAAELSAARQEAGEDPMLREAIDAELDRRRR